MARKKQGFSLNFSKKILIFLVEPFPDSFKKINFLGRALAKLTLWSGHNV